MDTFLEQSLMVAGTLFLIFGFLNSNAQHLNMPTVTFSQQIVAWNDSCVRIDCKIKYTETLKTYVWFQNPMFNETIKEFQGNIVYNSSMENAVNSPFQDRVQYVGKESDDCSILIKQLHREDSGIYQLRMWTNNKKWMSTNKLNLTVSDSGPTFKIEPQVSKTREFQNVQLTCSVNHYCPENHMNLSWTGHTTSKTQTFTAGDLGMKNILTFKASWTDHNKTVTCLLERPAKEVENRSIQLNIEYAPKGVQISPNNSKITIKRGDKLILNCMVESSNPSVHAFKWYNMNTQKANKQSYQVVDPGKYKCEAENTIGKKESNTVEVQVQYPPELVEIKILTGIIKEDENVILECSAKADPPITKHKWYRNRILVSNQIKTYQFNPINEYDSASYVCEVTNALGSRNSSSKELDVQYPPKYPEVVLDPDGRSFIEGKEVTFTCKVNRSNPYIKTITWYRNGNVISISSPVRLTPKYSGKYKCGARNEVGHTFSQEIPITVRYPPEEVKVEISNKGQITEGQKVSLTCTASQCEPKVNGFQWYKDGAHYGKINNVITFENIKWTDSGDYFCEAKHDIKNIRSVPIYINVLYAPCNLSLSVNPSALATENSLVELKCNIKANPMPNNYQWHKNDVPISNEYYKTLRLVNIKLEDEGKYHCTATNNVGTGKSDTVIIDVTYSIYTIAKYSSGAAGLFLLLIVLIVLIIRFTIWNKCKRQTSDDISDSSFFVLKKSHNETPEGGVRQCPSIDISEDQINYASIQFASSDEGDYQVPRKNANSQDINAIYSLVKKPRCSTELNEYENVKSSNNPTNSKEELHYSTITNLPKGGSVHQPDPGVEYAMLKQ
ncbi:B-cell receptor CD22 [Pelobates fuscus]|uniref:B-cell receptor CD22 n=1 Tax=Pelobates fuscus TaxID=191477 RepID=UPI002FE4C912